MNSGASRAGKLPVKIVMYALPFALIVTTLFIGRYPIPPQDVVTAFANVFGLGSYRVTSEVYTLVINVRFPRVIAAAAVGAALAISGAAFQGVFRNPLVSSGILGVSNGAGFGAGLAIVFFSATSVAIYPFAFLFGIVAVAASYLIARVYKSTPTIMLILGGTIVSSVFSALVSLMKYLADPETQLPNLVYWLMGSLDAVGYEEFVALIPMIAGAAILFLMSWRINVLSMGDKEARSMGVDTQRDKFLVIGGATLCTASAVCMSGVVGWVGLIIPHIGRMIVGSDSRKLMPASAAIGASFMMVIDLLARVITVSEVPLGVLTALVGAPFFVYLLKRTKGRNW